MNVLVTGASGFIGGNLCRALVHAGHRVRAFHRASSVLTLLDGLDVEHVVGDLTQPESVARAMQGIEVVFHAAAWMGSSDPGKLYAVTVEGTRTVLRYAREAGVRRVVHTSSVAALGVPEYRSPFPINENHTWNYHPKRYPYGYAKYLAELEVQRAVAQGLDVVIVNPALVFGSGDVYRQSRSLLKQVADRRIPFSVEGGLNVVHLEDVIEGHLAALERGRTGERYILGGENLSLHAMLSLAAAVVGAPPPAWMLPAGLVRTAAFPLRGLQRFLNLPIPVETLHLAGYYFYFDTTRARKELGITLGRTAREAFEDAWEWMRSPR
ncbi:MULTISPECIES: NAD-dependent epimerase/dehydratase family protein [Anaerolinea]|uniref:NAD-dependent epimerase/dehydratase family protein n=1 Tax=Anaerolinea TaxID=233189 RepID=UPI00260DC477|nr:NAD-dependent epimerase/dehydratase family protein [Anaerolinea thermophila]